MIHHDRHDFIEVLRDHVDGRVHWIGIAEVVDEANHHAHARAVVLSEPCVEVGQHRRWQWRSGHWIVRTVARRNFAIQTDVEAYDFGWPVPKVGLVLTLLCAVQPDIAVSAGRPFARRDRHAVGRKLIIRRQWRCGHRVWGRIDARVYASIGGNCSSVARRAGRRNEATRDDQVMSPHVCHGSAADTAHPASAGTCRCRIQPMARRCRIELGASIFRAEHHHD